MTKKDEKAFYKWFGKEVNKRVLHSGDGWKSACEYKQKEIKSLKSKNNKMLKALEELSESYDMGEYAERIFNEVKNKKKVHR